ncbi:hypothetical protein ADIS_0816 [Lunatimonas lonarensis]|uniref:Uncharacterized protein n=1 Tax=Lunatimonas lonarensis TaxID=1232681 RepID=R7ZX51_9BACT|nr:hypothetical protein ADIS_0816 [Lunatimonas lonarensis]
MWVRNPRQCTHFFVQENTFADVGFFNVYMNCFSAVTLNLAFFKIIFAWIIIHNRGQDRLWHWKTVDKGIRVGLESEKDVGVRKTKRNHDKMEHGNVVCFYMEVLKKAG